MRLFRMIGFYVAVAKGILHLLIYLSKKCRKLLVAVLAAIVAVYILFGFWLATLSTITGLVYVVYNFCDYLLYNPNDPLDSRTNIMSPVSYNLSFESLFITTEDKVRINAVLIKRPDNEYDKCPTMIYFHGNAGNIGHRLQNCYELYHEIGCNILLVEYRGYGLSNGYPSESGLYKDAVAALDYLLERPDIDQNKIVVFGRSLGAAVAIDLAKNGKHCQNIAAIIIENTFTSLPDIARTLFNCRLIRMIPNWFYKNQYNSLMKISSVVIPCLFVSGLNDELVPSSMMTSLFTLCSSQEKELHRLDGTHNFTWRCPNYYAILRTFLAKIMPEHKVMIAANTTTTTSNSATIGYQHTMNYTNLMVTNVHQLPQPLSAHQSLSPEQRQPSNQTLISFDDNDCKSFADHNTIEI
ncbi:protein ABHD13-like [Oppia nitens]|uniref:protein ABHD13-like n=1 Tax=Oppia nitens TaxID=1686743 RepID=UPI0023DA923C|nr:protein ABHD13-like [Oppia nitens]